MISTERLSELTGLIYDCVIEPQRWPIAMSTLRTELGFATSALTLHTVPGYETVLAATSGIEPEWLAKLQTYGEATIRIWGGPARMMQYPMAEPIVLSWAVERRTFQGNPYYDEWGKPLGLTDLVGIGLLRDSTAFGSAGFGWHGSRGDINESHLAPLRLMAPHLQRAVTISRLLDMQLLEATNFARALDALASAVLLVDSTLRIVHLNAAADKLLAAGDAISGRTGHLALVGQPRSQTALADAVGRLVAVHAINALGHRGIGIPVQRSRGAPLVAHVLPLPQGDLHSGLPQRAVAAVFVADAALPTRLPSDALALLYDLTPAETRVLELVAAGRSPAEVSAQLGVAPSTVKTHLLRVFDKTGCSRQAELVRLAAALSL